MQRSVKCTHIIDTSFVSIDSFFVMIKSFKSKTQNHLFDNYKKITLFCSFILTYKKSYYVTCLSVNQSGKNPFSKYLSRLID